MTFSVLPCRYHFRAAGPLFFPPGLAGNTFRGALGLLLREVVCEPLCPGAKTCARASTCAYARCFEPRQLGDGPSGFEDLPRPFVLRAAALDGVRVPAGGVFALDLHLFDLTPGLPALFGEALGRLAQAGLGPGRPPVVLERAEEFSPVTLGLAAGDAVNRLTLRFVTPTEIKSNGRILTEPRFDAVFGRARDRVSQLAGLYQEPLALDFRGLGERSRTVRLIHADVRGAKVERRSTRTGQRHALSGFTGEALYEGELSEFVPILRAAAWCGVGRHTVWGLGHVEVV